MVGREGAEVLFPTRLSTVRPAGFPVCYWPAALDHLRQAPPPHDLRDRVVALERTGSYHQPSPRALRQAGYDTRLVQPCTTTQYRRPAHPGDKTADTDRAARCYATSHGFGLCEPDGPARDVVLQRCRRQRCQGAYAFQRLADAGALLCFGSDWPVVCPFGSRIRENSGGGTRILTNSATKRTHYQRSAALGHSASGRGALAELKTLVRGRVAARRSQSATRTGT